jgi:putative MATE family efflux protein
MARVSREEILNGPIILTMVRLGWPGMVTGVLQTLYNLADAFWIGHLPPAESGPSVAGIQISWPVVWLLISFIGGFGGAAGSALISQYTGARRSEEANLACSQIFSLSFASGLVVGVGGFFFSPHILPLLVGAGEVSEVATLYIRVIFLGLPFMFAPFLFYFSLAAYGDTVTPMLVNGAGVLLNIGLDPLLIFGLGPFPKMGVFGAALATVIAEGLVSIVALVILFRGRRGLKLSLPALRPQMGLGEEDPRDRGPPPRSASRGRPWGSCSSWRSSGESPIRRSRSPPTGSGIGSSAYSSSPSTGSGWA